MGLFHNRKVTKALEQLRSPDVEKRTKAILRLGQLRDVRAVEPLILLLKSYAIPMEDWEERREYELSKSPKDIKYVRKTNPVYDKEVREVVEVLIRIGDKRAIPVIREFWKASNKGDGPFGNRKLWWDALIKLGDPQTLEAERKREEERARRQQKYDEMRRVMSNKAEIRRLLTRLEIIEESDPLITEKVRGAYKIRGYDPSRVMDLEQTTDRVYEYWMRGVSSHQSFRIEEKELHLSLRWDSEVDIVRLGENAFYLWLYSWRVDV